MPKSKVKALVAAVVTAVAVSLLASCSSSGNVTRAKIVAPKTVNVPSQVRAELAPHLLSFTSVLEAHGFVPGRSQDPNALSLEISFDPNPFAMKVSGTLRQKGAPIAIGSATNHGWGTVIAEGAAIGSLVAKAARELDVQLGQLSGRLEIVEDRPAPVAPTPQASGPMISTGTAFAVNGSRLLATAFHVVANASQVEVECASTARMVASVEKIDPANDLALLSVPRDVPTYLSLAPSGSASSGDDVFSLGFPASEILGKEPKYTEGVISSLTGLGGMANLMQITTPVQPGNSGGPLCNETGDVIGVITSTAAVENFYQQTGSIPQNVNWAVKSEYLLPMLPAQSKELATPRDRRAAIDKVKNSVCLVYAQK